jgi:hypothetical protein
MDHARESITCVEVVEAKIDRALNKKLKPILKYNIVSVNYLIINMLYTF